MSSFEFAYLCLSIACFVFFGVGLAGVAAYSNAKPKEQDVAIAPKSARA